MFPFTILLFFLFPSNLLLKKLLNNPFDTIHHCGSVSKLLRGFLVVVK